MSAKMTTKRIVSEAENGKILTVTLTSRHCTEKEKPSDTFMKDSANDENVSCFKDASISDKEVVTASMASATESKILANVEEDSNVVGTLKLSTTSEPQVDSQKCNNAFKLTVSLSSNASKLQNELKVDQVPDTSKVGYNFNIANLDEPNTKFINLDEWDGVYEFNAEDQTESESFCENNNFEKSFSYTSFLDDSPLEAARNDELSPPKKKVCLNAEADNSEKHKKDMDASELSDMTNPNWKKLKDEKPEKWFEVVHKQWRSSEIPDPHKNLTIRYQKKTWKQIRGIFTKKHFGRRADVPLVKHLYNNQIRDLYKRIDDLRKEMDFLYSKKRNHNRMYCNYRIDALYLEEQQCRDAIRNYKDNIRELEYVLSFYQQGLILTDYMQSEAERQIVIRERMNKYYGNS